MALTDVITISIVDNDGDRRSLPIYMPTGLTLAQLNDGAAQIAAQVDAVIDGQIIEMSVTHNVTLPGGLKAGPVAFCEVQKGALFSFFAAGTNRTYSTYIPTFRPDLFINDDVDSSDADVSVLETNYLDGWGLTGGGTLAPSDEYGNDLTFLKKAVKTFRK